MRPIELFTRRFSNQKMDYINKLVVAGIVSIDLLEACLKIYFWKRGLLQIDEIGFKK
jgi:hypothetical protein